MKSKRMRSMSICLIANFGIFLFGIWKGVDLTALGTGLAALNAPLYMYQWGETTRPSGTMKKDTIQTTQPEE